MTEATKAMPAPLVWTWCGYLTGVTGEYHLDVGADETTIITPDGKHRFSFDPRVTMDVVHIIAGAHRDGVLVGAASAAAPKASSVDAVAPAGVVAILTDGAGAVVASATDFGGTTSGGITRRETQEMRARKKLGAAMLEAYCAGPLQEAMSWMDLDRLVSRLTAHHGHRVTILAVGGGEAGDQ